MKIHKQVRGFDIAEYIAFNTFPTIRNAKIGFYSSTQETYIMDTRTGELACRVCDNIDDCRELAKMANRMIRNTTKMLEVVNNEQVPCYIRVRPEH